MSEAILKFLISSTASLSIALILIVSLRKAVRERFGAQSAYFLWLLVPIALIATTLPARRVVASELLPSKVPIEFPNFDQIFATAEAWGPDTPSGAGPGADASLLFLGLWLVGVFISLGSLAIEHWRFYRSLGLDHHKSGLQITHKSNIGPTVFGILKPRILVPFDFEETFNLRERTLILAHEKAHIQAGDLVINLIAALIASLNWFNPLVHLSRSKFRNDQELACDARVLSKHPKLKHIYARAILKSQVQRNMAPMACNWPSRSKGFVKERIITLTKAAPNAVHRKIGNGLFAILALATGIVCWAIQPATIAHAQGQNFGAISDAIESDSLEHRLMAAIQSGDIKKTKELIRAGVDVNYVRHGDGTPMILAINEGHAEIVYALLDARADINKTAEADGSPMTAAAANNETKFLKLFLEAGAEIDEVVAGDETPLITAAASGHLEAAEFLLSNGADVDLTVKAPTWSGIEMRSALSQAEKFKHTRMTQLLKQYGAQQ